MDKPKIYIAGHEGMVGSSVLKIFQDKGYRHIVTRARRDLDLREQGAVQQLMKKERPEVVINAAAIVGGIVANDRYPYQFLFDNLTIQNNIIDAAHTYDVDRLIFLGSSCIYPRHSPQPIREDYLLTGELESTNQWYAIAKIAGVKLCEALNKQYDRNYVAFMPTNLYGPNDNFDLETSHVAPAMIRKFHEARDRNHQPVALWGTGTPRRELLHVDDLASAVCFAVENWLDGGLYNIGTGSDMTIRELAELIQKIVGHRGDIVWDDSKPDGTPRKVLDVSKIHARGWQHQIGLEEGLRQTYDWFLSNKQALKEIKLQA